MEDYSTQQILGFALRNTDINLWYFNCDTGECVQGENCQMVHGRDGAAKLYNFPECLIEAGEIREDSIEPLREAYRKLAETGECVEFDVWYRKTDGSGWWCERDMLTAIRGRDGRVERGIGVGKNITSEKELLRRYQEFQSYRAIAEKNTVASFRLNLTGGLFDECVSDNSIVHRVYTVGNLDDFFDKIQKHLVLTDDLVRRGFTLSREYLLNAFARGETSLSVEYRYRSESGRVIWFRTDVEMMRNPATEDVEALLHTYNIDCEKITLLIVEKLLSSNYEFIGVFDIATGKQMVLGENKDTNIDGISRDGGNYEELMIRVFQKLILPEYFEEGVRNMRIAHVVKELEDKEHYICSFPTQGVGDAGTGRKQWKFSYLDDSKTRVLVIRTDITDVYTAEYDELTGLYNRQAFNRHVREVLDASPEEKFLLLRCDIDRFKAYNDVCGAPAGDRLLAEFGRTVRKNCWTKRTVVGRLEADHFCVLVPQNGFYMREWEKLHTDWLESAAAGFRLTSSIGIYEITDPSLNVSLMCDRALLALRTVKDSYNVKLKWYDESLRKKLMKEQALVDAMDEALLREQFILYFQPQVNYENKTIIGAEILVRWQKPDCGVISPGDFIPIFEKNGFILKLDAYIWEQSCAYLRRRLDFGGTYAKLPMSVNVSRCDLYDPGLCSRLKALVEKYGLPMELLKLEITESAYMEDPGQLIGVVDKLRRMGFSVEMDDFGTGYSSLTMLKDVLVDLVKLDMKFLSREEDDSRGATILSMVIQMADNLGLPVLAEGIETASQADYLHGLGCSNMQGYYFGMPMPEAAFEEFLMDSSYEPA